MTETVSGQLPHTQAYARGELTVTDTVSGRRLPSTRLYHTRDIFKDGPGDALTAQLSLIDLAEAIHPLACEDCGHVEPMSVGDVEHCLLQAQDAIRKVEPHQRDQWVQKLFQLLWDSRDEFHKDWLEGLRQCPKKGWAGQVLLTMRASLAGTAWNTLRTALGGV
jgi:molybdenum cofactor biosynthesis enzyme MoaA